MSKDKTENDVAFIEALANLLKQSDLAEIEVEREYGEDDELKVRLSRYASAAAPVAAAAPYAPALAAPAPVAPGAPGAPVGAAPAASPPAAVSDTPADDPGCVKSPMVGTVYLSPSPDAAPYIREGDTVNKGQTLLIIEAMKTMNQIPAPRSGVVKRIVAGDKQPVEYDAPLLILE